MAKKNLLVFLVSVLVLAFAIQSASAVSFGNIANVEVNGIPASAGVVNFASFAGQKMPVLVRFDATANAMDVKMKAWISGEKGNAADSDRFDVIAGGTYSMLVYVDIPTDMNDNLDEPRTLEIIVESRQDGIADEETIQFRVQRESYDIEILAVNMDGQVKAGEPLPIDVVLKNKGRHFADDTFLKIKVPELGIETQTYFGDLSPVDQGNPDKEDAVERRAFLRIPSSAKAGVYTVILEAFNGDSVDSLERKIMVSGASEDTMIVASAPEQTFSTNEEGEYTITIVNKGSEVRVYELSIVTPTELDLTLSEPVVVVPAGSSRTVKMTASAKEEGKYTFTVNVFSDGQATDTKSFKANVKSATGAKGTGVNTTVLLTVILAIVFVVLLVVLIVLLTRKPETKEDFSESSYY